MNNGEALGRAPLLLDSSPREMNYAIFPAPRLGKVNLLDEWRLEARAHSSRFAPKPLFSRQAVELVERVLAQSFPSSFFDHTYGRDQTAWDINIVSRLLITPKSKMALRALVEICQLLEYAKVRQPALHEALQQQMFSPVQFQASLYEAYIAVRLERSGLAYQCGTKENGKPLDGFFSFGTTMCRVECKQPFTPNANESDVMRRVIDKTILELGRVGVGRGFGFALRLNRPVAPTVVHEASELVKRAIQLLSEGGQKLPPDLVVKAKGCSIDLLPVGVIDPGKTSSDSELVARIEVNAEHDTPDTTATASVHISWGFSYLDSEVVDRLRDMIQRARKQHKGRASDKLIVCVDSQELNDFRFGLLQANETLERASTQQRIRSVLSDTIVLVTRRLYSGQRMVHKGYVFNKDNDQALGDHLRKVFTAR